MEMFENKTCSRQFQELRRMCLSAGTHGYKASIGSFVVSMIANKPSGLRRHVEPRGGVHLIPPKINPGYYEIPSDVKERDDQNPPEDIPDGRKAPSHGQKGNDRMPPQSMPDNDKITIDEQEGAQRIPQKYRIPYSEIGRFQQAGDTLPLSKRNYKVSMTISLMAKMMHNTNVMFDTVTALDLILEEFIEAKWLKAIQTNSRPALKNTTNRKVSVVGMISLHVVVGYSRARVVFGIVPNLAVQVRLENSFINRFVKGILPLERRIVLYYFKPVPTLFINDLPK